MSSQDIKKTVSPEDQAALDAAGKAWVEANKEWEAAKAANNQAKMDYYQNLKDKAHNDAEAIRIGNYGYSGGADGSARIPTSAGSAASSAPSSSVVKSGASTSGSVSQDIKKNEYTPVGPGDGAVREEVGMSPEDQAALNAAGGAWIEANKEWEAAKAANNQEKMAYYQALKDKAHADAEAIRIGSYGYSGGADGSERIPAPPVTTPQEPPSPQGNYTAQVPDFTGLLDSWLESAKGQQEGKIDYATQQGILDLQRAEEDAQEKFDAQEKQTNIDEAKALDNQALYAEARGDRGGIGQAQYAQIQAQAMQNRHAINAARTKLSTDVARQITDLRAQGEFEKADALLQLTQTYLGQLVDLQKWGAEYSLNVAQFNAQLQQWQAEFEQEASRWQMEFDYTTSQDNQSILAASGAAALSVGVRPSKAQQAAMGYTDAQINAELAAYKLAQAAGVNSPGTDPAIPGLDDIFSKMYVSGVRTAAQAEYYLENTAKVEGSVETYVDEYLEALDNGSLAESNAEIDEDWVYATYGRVISPQWLAEQVAAGRLETYIASNGKKRFREVPTLGGSGGVVGRPLSGTWKEVALNG